MESSVLPLKKWTPRILAISLALSILSLALNQSPPPTAALLRTATDLPLSRIAPAAAPGPSAPPPPHHAPPPITFFPPDNHSTVQENTLPAFPPPRNRTELLLLPPRPKAVEVGKCDLFQGKWVFDRKNYPLYRARACPFLSEQVSCRKNGRPDSDYEHWRWQPHACNLRRFDGRKMLERLRGKRVVMVGDSLNRNQWESLVCLLYSSVRRRRAYVKGTIDYRIFKALDYHCSVEFFLSPFLIELEEKNGKKVLKLDKLPASERRWRGADLMVFNSGHWWTHHGRLRTWNYYEHNGELVEMEEGRAYEVALHTWAHWVDKWVDQKKTIVFFRSISPEHKLKNLQWCYNQTQPLTNETYRQTFLRSMRLTVERAIRSMSTPVRYLNITQLSEYRRDAHTSVYTTRKGKLLTNDQQRQPSDYADCSHWCLPGLPDTWNLLLYASIMGFPSTHL